MFDDYYDNDDLDLPPLLDDNDDDSNDDNYNNNNDANNNDDNVLYPPLYQVIHNTIQKPYNDVALMYADAPLEAIQQVPLDVICNEGHNLEEDTTEHLPPIDSVSTIGPLSPHSRL